MYNNPIVKIRVHGRGLRARNAVSRDAARRAGLSATAELLVIITTIRPQRSVS